ncbi:MAG: hypothetical protein IKJ59_03500, partial [Clostridia bacterium]|nr:hypothetical protein [Clostridia bacterium]
WICEKAISLHAEYLFCYLPLRIPSAVCSKLLFGVAVSFSGSYSFHTGNHWRRNNPQGLQNGAKARSLVKLKLQSLCERVGYRVKVDIEKLNAFMLAQEVG